MRRLLIVMLATTLVGCGSKAETFTLYRNSGTSTDLRVHWATFDADESSTSYNQTNCTMAARILNANMKTLSGAAYDPRIGFWCEPGRFEEEGSVPGSFEATFPLDG